MEIFKGLQPELVWSYFEEICKIPRPSKKEEKIAIAKNLLDILDNETIALKTD